MKTDKCSNWGASHSRVYRHLDYFIKKSLENVDGFLSMDEIRQLLKEETDFLFHPETLRKYNRKYAEEHGMGLLCQFGDRYKLNRCLYELKGVKPPREYKKK